jgi:hypothetical protein
MLDTLDPIRTLKLRNTRLGWYWNGGPSKEFKNLLVLLLLHHYNVTVKPEN